MQLFLSWVIAMECLLASGLNSEVSMDEFIAEAMRTDIKYDVTADSIDHLCSVRHILKDGILTCSQGKGLAL